MTFSLPKSLLYIAGKLRKIAKSEDIGYHLNLGTAHFSQNSETPIVQVQQLFYGKGMILPTLPLVG